MVIIIIIIIFKKIIFYTVSNFLMPLKLLEQLLIGFIIIYNGKLTIVLIASSLKASVLL